MTRKDYLALAAMMAAVKDQLTRNPEDLSKLVVDILQNKRHVSEFQLYAWNTMLRQLANVLSTDNPRFDYDRFCAACHKG